jgi:hypothetical protein
MRFREFKSLSESTRGLLFRNVGDVFTSIQDPSKTLTFAGSEVFPSPKGSFDPETFQEVVDQVERKYRGIHWVNKATKSSLAFAVVTLIDPTTKKKLYFGRFFKEILPNMAGLWLNDGIPGYQLGIKSSKKSRSGLKPVDLLPTGQQFKNPTSLIASIKEGTDPALIQGLQLILKGKLPYFKVSPELEASIRDDLGEIIAPMCLWQGMISDDAEKARKFLLKRTLWNSCSIAFSEAKNSGLVDSIVRPPKGVAVGISSKGASGAKASASNIYSGIELLRNTGQDDVVNKYPETVHVLETIVKQTAINGPISLGTEYGFCTAIDGQLIQDAIKRGVQQVPGTPKYKNIRFLMSNFSPRKMDQSNYNIGYHALAGLAKIVAAHINSSTPNFSEACLTFLNSSPLLQIHLYTKADKNGVAVTGFKTIWPPEFNGSVQLNAGKSYYATGAINKFAFGF